MYRALSDPEKLATHRGYSAGLHQENETRAKDTRRFTLFSRVNQRATPHTSHRPTLAAESGISNQSIWRLISGQAVSVRGWEITDDINEVPLFDSDFETQIPVYSEDAPILDDELLLPGEEDI